jgi:hypothetical protein
LFGLFQLKNVHIACSISKRSPPSPLKLTFSDLNFFCTFFSIKKKSAYHVFRKHHLKTIYSGTNFSSFLDFRLYTFYHSSVNFCDRTNCLGLLGRYFIGKYKKNKKQQQQHYFVFLLGVTENGITQKTYF